ncbi:MAG TPA: hypothetical protein VGE74_17900 [Gemmata sp.]
MYDPNDCVDIEVDGRKLRCRLVTERQVKAVKRLTHEARTAGTLDERHAKANEALAIGLVGFDPEDLTLIQKFAIADAYPWEATVAEANRLKKASPSPSDAPTT